VIVVVVVGLLTGCGQTDDGMDTSGAWARTSPMSATAGAVYMDITSGDDDRLVAAAVPSNVAAAVEIHETVMVDAVGDGESVDDADGSMEESEESTHDGSMDDDSAGGDGAMTMRELENGLELPAGETVTLAPGGLHFMLVELADPLQAGETFDLTLEFESGVTEVVSVEVRDDAP
jgi:copper(I)-binding protein